MGELKKLISKILSLFNLSLIRKDKLIKLDVERKKYRYEYEKLDFIFLNDRVKNPGRLYKLIELSESQIFQDLFVINELDFKEDGFFVENTPYDPRSPYSASKASSDHLVRAWHETYGLPVILTNCSNNYGPYHFPEKLIPVVIISALNEKRIPVYGDGKQIRDWIYVSDHCDALMSCIKHGKVGETYNIGSSNQLSNLDLIGIICSIMDKIQPRKNSKSYKDLIDFIKDRPGHDRKYGINSTKAMKELDWKPKIEFNQALEDTIKWYLDNQGWWKNLLLSKK